MKIPPLCGILIYMVVICTPVKWRVFFLYKFFMKGVVILLDYNPHYYNEDNQIGDRCFFDGKDVYLDFNADLKEFRLTPGKMDADYSPTPGGCAFNLFSADAEPMELSLEFYVGGPSPEAVQTNISGLLMAAKQCVIRREGDIFEYAAVLTGRDSEETGVEPYYLLSLEFSVIRRKPLVSHQIVDTAVIYNDGNTASGAKISISPEKAMDSFTVMGITIEDLEPGITYVIDGMEGRVTANGVNYFAHTDLIEFPKIQPGKNEIVMSAAVSVTVSFYPVFS